MAAVNWVGSQRDVLQGDIDGHIDLRTLSRLEHLYAVGPAAGLRGEVSIFDSVPSISRVAGGVITTETEFNVNACFLVYAQVNEWRETPLAEAVTDEKALETRIVQIALELRIDVRRPFPFMIRATPEHGSFHILDKRDGLPHNSELHEKAKVRFTIAREPVEVIGFYSSRHRGIFTPANANVHMHIRTTDGRLSGHLETIRLQPGATLCVPAWRTADET